MGEPLCAPDLRYRPVSPSPSCWTRPCPATSSPWAPRGGAERGLGLARALVGLLRARPASGLLRRGHGAAIHAARQGGPAGNVGNGNPHDGRSALLVPPPFHWDIYIYLTARLGIPDIIRTCLSAIESHLSLSIRLACFSMNRLRPSASHPSRTLPAPPSPRGVRCGLESCRAMPPRSPPPLKSPRLQTKKAQKSH